MVFYFTLFFVFINGLGVAFPLYPNSDSLLVANIGSNRLQTIVASKAVMSTVFNTINEEVFTNNYFINDITSSHLHLQNDLSSLVFIGGLIYYRYHFIIPKIDKKLGDIEYFYTIRRKINMFVIFFLFVFVKNVGCAF
jgi:hypothetical protein